MTLNNYIYRQIFLWPSLYYKKTFEDSKVDILNQLFLVIGSGIDYNADGTFGEDKFPIAPKDYIKRISNGERIVTVYTKAKCVNQHILTDGGKEKTMFYGDFLSKHDKFYEWGQKITGKVKNYPVINIYPKDKDMEWYPYPFCMEYCPFYNKKRLFPKNKIQKDWRDGIVYIFSLAKVWFESDAWDNNEYYNWGHKNHWTPTQNNFFIENWKKKGLQDLCKDYEIPYRYFSSAQEMASAICQNNRKKYIDNCNTIIEFYT